MDSLPIVLNVYYQSFLIESLMSIPTIPTIPGTPYLIIDKSQTI